MRGIKNQDVFSSDMKFDSPKEIWLNSLNWQKDFFNVHLSDMAPLQPTGIVIGY